MQCASKKVSTAMQRLRIIKTYYSPLNNIYDKAKIPTHLYVRRRQQSKIANSEQSKDRSVI